MTAWTPAIRPDSFLRWPSCDTGKVTTAAPPHHHEARHPQMSHEALGGDPRHRLAAGLELAPSVVGQREGERLAEIVRIGGMEWLVAGMPRG